MRSFFGGSQEKMAIWEQGKGIGGTREGIGGLLEML
jgi:hypothetical protein